MELTKKTARKFRVEADVGNECWMRHGRDRDEEF